MRFPLPRDFRPAPTLGRAGENQLRGGVQQPQGEIHSETLLEQRDGLIFRNLYLGGEHERGARLCARVEKQV